MSVSLFTDLGIELNQLGLVPLMRVEGGVQPCKVDQKVRGRGNGDVHRRAQDPILYNEECIYTSRS